MMRTLVLPLCCRCSRPAYCCSVPFQDTHQPKDVLHLQGRRDRFRRTRSPHEHRQILRRLPVLAQPPLRHGPTQQGGSRRNLDLAGAPARLVRPDPGQCRQELLGVLWWGYHSHGTEHVVHVVPEDPMPGRRLDLATDQLVLPESSDQLIPVPRGMHRRHSPVPGPAGVNCLRTAACSGLPLCSPRSSRSRHACHAGIGLDALLKLLVDLNHRIADMSNLIALPRNGQEHLPAPAPSSHDGSPSETGRETPPP